MGPAIASVSLDLERIRAISVPTADVQAIESELPERSAELRVLVDDLSEEHIAGVVRLSTLDDLQRVWTRRSREFEGWNRTLSRHLRRQEESLSELRTLKERWTLTRQMALDNELPPALVARIESTIVSIREVRKTVGDRRGEILVLQNQISKEEGQIANVAERLNGAREVLRDQLFAYDSPPIWTVLLDPPDREPFGERIEKSMTRYRENIEGFLDRGTDRFLTHGIVLAASLLFCFFLQARAHRWAREDRDFEGPARVLARPVSSALLITLIATPWIHPNAPNVVIEIAIILGFVPILRLLPVILPAPLRVAVYALVPLLIAHHMQDAIRSLPVLARLLLLADSSAASAGILWMLRPTRLKDLPQDSKWLHALGYAVRAALLLLVVSVFANLLGNVSLAEVITGAVLNGAYLGVLLYAAARVSDGVIAVLLRTPLARRLRSVRLHTPLFKQRFTAAIRVGLTLLWALLVLDLFKAREKVVSFIVAALNTSVEVGDLSLSLGDVLAFIFMIWASFLASRLIRFALDEDVLPRVDLPRGVPSTLLTTAHYVTLMLGFFFAMAAAGIELQRFAILVGALGVGIGFGLQNIVNNFVSGLVLLFERPIQPGDVVEVGALIGEVKRIGIRSSTVRTFEGAEVIVPNANLVSDQVVNWTLSDPYRRIEIPVGVAYGTDPQEVITLLFDVASAHPDVHNNPEPTALFLGFGDSSLDFALRCWTATETYRLVASDVSVKIHSALRASGIEIPFPQRDLHLRTVSPEARRGSADPGESVAPAADDQ